MSFSNKKNALLFCSFALIASILSLSGCARSNGIAAANDPVEQAKEDANARKIYSIYATAMNDVDALNAATNKVAQFCHLKGKQFEIIDYTTKYVGYSEKQKQLIYQANKELGQNKNAASEQDYRVTIKFRCQTKEK